MTAPDLGDNPDNNCECFFFATKDIEVGDFFLWHYGLFHGINKHRYIDYDDDDDEDEDDLIVDYDDDLEMARQLSLSLNGPSPSRLSLDGNGDDEPDSDQVAKRGKHSSAKKIGRPVKTKKKQGCKDARAETAPSDSSFTSAHSATAFTSDGKKRKKHDDGNASFEIDDDDEDEDDYDADLETAGQLSLSFNGPSPSRHLSPSLDGNGDDEPDSDQVPSKRGKHSAKKIGRPVKTKKKKRRMEQTLIEEEHATPELTFSTVVSAQAATATITSSPEDFAVQSDCISSDGEGLGFNNESQLEAEKDQTVYVNLSTYSAADIWDALLSNKKMKGGFMARSLFLAGIDVDEKICDRWIGGKTLCTKKLELIDQRKLFLQWANDIRALRWIRDTIFTIVLAKPQTYKLLTVQHADFPRKTGDDSATQDGITLTVLETTDDTMARIAHLACESECRTAMLMIHDAKAREVIENKDLQVAALWQDLADQFVNNVNWETADLHVAQLDYMKILPDGSQERRKRVDATVPPYPGLSGETVRDAFTAVKAMFKKVTDAVFGTTGCNTTGEELYGQVWKNYIKGKLMYFPRPEVAMYVFKLWNECQMLPKYCIKELKPEAQCRVGVTSTSYTFPVTPRIRGTPVSSTTTASFQSPNSSGSASAATTASIDKLANYLDMERELMLQRRIEEDTKPKVYLYSFLYLYLYYIDIYIYIYSYIYIHFYSYIYIYIYIHIHIHIHIHIYIYIYYLY